MTYVKFIKDFYIIKKGSTGIVNDRYFDLDRDRKVTVFLDRCNSLTDHLRSISSRKIEETPVDRLQEISEEDYFEFRDRLPTICIRHTSSIRWSHEPHYNQRVCHECRITHPELLQSSPDEKGPWPSRDFN